MCEGKGDACAEPIHLFKVEIVQKYMKINKLEAIRHFKMSNPSTTTNQYNYKTTGLKIHEETG